MGSCLLGVFFLVVSQGAVVDGPVHNGVEVQIDLPPSQHVQNIGAPKDGKGCCVFASADMAARFQNVLPLIDVINRIEYGGGWPEKVDEVIQAENERAAKEAAAKGLPAPDVVEVAQHEGTNLDFMRLVLSTGRPCCVTYGFGERYGKTIYHMVLLVHLDDKMACIIDNNFPGTYEWMSAETFKERWTHPNGTGWAFAILAPPPPPAPSN
jgi:hypothetical protein